MNCFRPLAGRSIPNPSLKTTKQHRHGSSFRPLAGRSIPNHTERSCDSSCLARFRPLAGRSIPNLICALQTDRLITVSVPLRGDLFLIIELLSIAGYVVYGFRPLAGRSIPNQVVTVESKHNGSVTFPSPCGEIYS